jgi:uncharacterized protein YlzI (FlbEa/FlbD family)
MKRILAFALVVFCIPACKNNSSSQKTRTISNETEANIYRSADSMMAAFKRKDWVTFAKYNHPSMEKMIGGSEAFSSFINEQMKQVPDTAIKNLEAGKILQVVKTDKDEQCVLEQIMEMQMNGTRLIKTTYLIGESLDSGKTWTFLDASTGMAPKDLKKDISPELKIPEKKQRVEQL